MVEYRGARIGKERLWSRPTLSGWWLEIREDPQFLRLNMRLNSLRGRQEEG